MKPVEHLAWLCVEAHLHFRLPFQFYRLGCWLYGVDLDLGIKRGKYILNPDYRDEPNGGPRYITA